MHVIGMKVPNVRALNNVLTLGSHDLLWTRSAVSAIPQCPMQWFFSGKMNIHAFGERINLSLTLMGSSVLTTMDRFPRNLRSAAMQASPR
jgi:hypothetical protein